MPEKPFENIEDLRQIKELSDVERMDLVLRKTTEIINALVWFILNSPDKYPEVAEKTSRINRLMIDINIHSSNLTNDELTEKEQSLMKKLTSIETNNPAELIKIILPLYLSLESKKASESEFVEEIDPRLRLGIFIKFVKQIMQQIAIKPAHEKLLELGKITVLLEDSANQDEELIGLIGDIQRYIELNFLQHPLNFDNETLNDLISRVAELYDNYGLVVQ